MDDIIVPIRSSSKAQFPRCSFTRGITNLTLLTADERAGVAFVLALVAASKPGSDILTRQLQELKMLQIGVKELMLIWMMMANSYWNWMLERMMKWKLFM